MSGKERKPREKVELSEEMKLRETGEKGIGKKDFQTLEYPDPFISVFSRLERTALTVNKLDYYGNVIPFGAFCNAVALVLFGFSLCGVHGGQDYFLWSVMLFFGAIGQITAGLLEFIKGRTYPSTLYLTYGLYCLSHFLLRKSDLYGTNANALKVFYGSWAGLTFPLFIGSFKTNLFYLLQSLATCGYFVIECIGHCLETKVLKEKVSGIVLAVAGFISLYIGINQIINEQFRNQIVPAFPLSEDNEIDVKRKKK